MKTNRYAMFDRLRPVTDNEPLLDASAEAQRQEALAEAQQLRQEQTATAQKLHKALFGDVTQ